MGKVKALPYLTFQPSISALPFPLIQAGALPRLLPTHTASPQQKALRPLLGHVPREKGKEGYSSSMGLKGSCQAIASASLA